jgi:hypothetical protein
VLTCYCRIVPTQAPHTAQVCLSCQDPRYGMTLVFRSYYAVLKVMLKHRVVAHPQIVRPSPSYNRRGYLLSLRVFWSSAIGLLWSRIKTHEKIKMKQTKNTRVPVRVSTRKQLGPKLILKARARFLGEAKKPTSLAMPGDTWWGTHHKTLTRLMLMWVRCYCVREY